MSMGRLVDAALKADKPLMLWGPPGVGKTAWVNARAQKAGAWLETLILSQCDPTDIGGYLALDATGQVRTSAPPWARRLKLALDRGQPAWLFCDELSCAPPACQAGALRMIHDRVVADLSLLGIRVLAAGNGAESAADVGWLTWPMRGRFAHVDFKVDVPNWVTGTLTGWGKELSPEEAAACQKVVPFIAAHHGALAPALPKVDSGTGGWPSPRTWSAGIAIIAQDPELWREALEATVGIAAASEAAAYAEALDLPLPIDVLLGHAKVPSRGDLASATLMSVASYALSNHEERERDTALAWKVVAGQRPDVALAAAQTLYRGTDGEVPVECEDLGRRILLAREAVAGK